MKKLLFVGVCATLLTANAFAGENDESLVYTGIRAGASGFDLSGFNKNVFMMTASNGRRFSPYLRAELEYGFRGPGDIGYLRFYSHSITGQLYADFPTDTILTPFVNLGGGANIAIWTVNDYSDTDVTFSWNIGGGLSFKLNEKADIELMYRYTDFGTPFDIKVNSTDITLGFRIKF